MAKQQKRITQTQSSYIDPKSSVPKPVNYKGVGLLWGLLMDLSFGVFEVLELAGKYRFTWLELIGAYVVAVVAGLIICLPAGWLCGFLIKLILEKKGDPALHLAIEKGRHNSTVQSVRTG